MLPRLTLIVSFLTLWWSSAVHLGPGCVQLIDSTREEKTADYPNPHQVADDQKNDHGNAQGFHVVHAPIAFIRGCLFCCLVAGGHFVAVDEGWAIDDPDGLEQVHPEFEEES